MKNNLFIAIFLSFVLTGEAIGCALLYSQHEACLVDLGLDGEAEKDAQEKDTKNKLQIKLAPKAREVRGFPYQNVYNHLDISQQVSKEVVTPPPK